MSDATTFEKRKYPLVTPFNIVAGIILLVGLGITVLRFTGGLAAVTNLDDNNPWGLWIGFDLLCGVALAAGGYITSSAVYIFGLKKYHGAVRPAILTAFLGYAFVVVALHYDVGRPWRLVYPLFWQPGPTSVLFEIGLCVFVYLSVLFIEFTPAALEWLGLKKIRNLVVKATMALTIMGVILSTMHQSSLGALYLITPGKLHPLWYSSYLPIFFFVSSAVAGLSMVIFEGSLSHRWLHEKMDQGYLGRHEDFVFSFSRAAAWVLMGYFTIKVIGIAADDNWRYLATPMGGWFLVEMLGFVALPGFLYAIAARERNMRLAQWTALLAVLGIVLNRFNVSLVAFNWKLPAAQRYFPSWQEIWISVFVVTLIVLCFRWISRAMPIFFEHPDYPEPHEAPAAAEHGAHH
ncbi:MAG: sulfate respiration complex protein HmcC [Desulfovibrionaceae bacterium]